MRILHKIFDAEKYLADTLSIEEVEMDDYDAIFIPGGHGTMFDFPGNKKLHSLLREFYESNRYVVSVCHGPAGLVVARRTTCKRKEGKCIH